MESIEQLINQLDTVVNKLWTQYLSLHEELNSHRGKPIDDTNLPEVNRILGEIQDTFAELYPAYSFIATRYQYASNAVTQYNEFIESLKSAGAQQNDPEAPKIIIH